MSPKIIKSETSWSINYEHNEFKVLFSPFRIEHRVQGELVMTLNDKDSLYFEASTGINADTCLGPSIDLSDSYPNDFIKNQTSNYPSYATSIDY